MARFATLGGSAAGRSIAFAHRKARRERADYSAFKSLIASPSDLGSVGAEGSSTELVLPANSQVAFSFSEALPYDDLHFHVGGKHFHNPELAAGQVHKIGYVEAGRSLSVERSASAPAGDFTIYIINPLGRPVPIATAVFS